MCRRTLVPSAIRFGSDLNGGTVSGLVARVPVMIVQALRFGSIKLRVGSARELAADGAPP